MEPLKISRENFPMSTMSAAGMIPINPTTIIANYVQEEKELPPILMFHGTNDELVPFGQSCQLFEALKNAKKDATFYQVIGAHHGGREFWTREVLDIEECFIKRVCNK